MPQRFTMIAALLVAANLAADLVVWRSLEADSRSRYLGIAYFALLSAQLSVVCVWAAFRARSKWVTAIAPLAAAVAASFAYGKVAEHRELDFLPYFGLQALLLLAGFWLFKRTRFWRHRSDHHVSWQFSVLHLLALMTIIAILTPLLQRSDLFGDDLALIVVFLGCTVAIVFVAVFVWSLNIHWLLALAAVFAAAFVLSGIFFAWDAWYHHYMFEFTLYHLLTQVVVIVAALAWGGILPAAQATPIHDA